MKRLWPSSTLTCLFAVLSLDALAGADGLPALVGRYREAAKKVGGTPESRQKKVEETVAPILTEIGKLDSDASLAFLVGELDGAPVGEAAAACVGPIASSSNPRAAGFLVNGLGRRPQAVQIATLQALASSRHDLKPHNAPLVAFAEAGLALKVRRHLPAVLGKLGTAPAARVLLEHVKEPRPGKGTDPEKERAQDQEAYNTGVHDALARSGAKEVTVWLEKEAFADAGANEEHLQLVLRLVRELNVEGARPSLEGLLQHPSPQTARLGLGALLQLGADASAKAIAGAAEGRPGARDLAFRMEALDALARTHRGPCLETVIRLTTASDVQTRNIAMGSLGFTSNPKAVVPLAHGLLDQDAGVRTVALRSLKRFRHKLMVGALIEALGKIDDEGFKTKVVDFLAELTGKNMGFVNEAWQSWWEEARDKFEFAKEGDKKAVTTVNYFGIGVESKRLALLVDASSSMEERVPVKSGADGKAGTTRKIEVLKNELARLLGTLPEDTEINLVSFDAKVHPWKKQLHPLLGAGRKEAIRHADGLKTASGTNVYDSLEFALNDSRVDTIYLLTDGVPSQGRFTQAEDIRREVAKLNRLRAVTIHCIAFGEESEFLKQLAGENSGKYRFVTGY